MQRDFNAKLTSKDEKREMKIVKAYNSVSLVLRIVIGMVIGAVLALIIPNAAETAPGIGILGTLFVGALKAIAPLLVFILSISALAQSREKMGKQFGTVIVLYLVSTFLAAVIAVIASFIFPVTITLTDAATDAAPDSFASIFTGLLNNIVANPIGSIVSGNYLGILFWAIVLGFAFKAASDTTKKFLADASDAVTKAVRFVINLAPFGILGLVFSAVSTSGLAIFTEYGKLLLILVGCMLIAALVVNPIMTFIVIRKNPYPLVFKCLKESGVTAFFTRSSAANIPVNMTLCESLGLDREFYSVSIPLGATINMAGGHHHRHVPRRGTHPRHERKRSRSDRPVRHGRSGRMRRIRRCRRLAASDPHGLFAVRHLQRCCNAGCRRRLHHRRHSGLCRDRDQLLLRRTVHRRCGIQAVAQGRQGNKVLSLIYSKPRRMTGLF